MTVKDKILSACFLQRHLRGMMEEQQQIQKHGFTFTSEPLTARAVSLNSRGRASGPVGQARRREAAGEKR